MTVKEELERVVRRLDYLRNRRAPDRWVHEEIEALTWLLDMGRERFPADFERAVSRAQAAP